MFSMNGLEIKAHRQDTGGFTITFSGDDAPADGTIVQMTVKSRPDKKAPVLWAKQLTVADSQVEITITKTDTDLTPGLYWWDVRILFEDGSEPYTPMDPAVFRVLEVVGDV